MTTTAPAELIQPSKARPPGGRWPRWIVLAVVVVLALGAWAVFGRGGGGEAVSVASLATYEAHSGPLTISVVESGTIKSREQVVIKNEVEGRVTILTLVPEGTHAKKGDLLVELDASKLQDTQVDQQIQVQNAYANLIRARENLEVAKNQAQSDVSKAELDYEFAQLNLRKYLEGDYPELLKTAESAIKLAEADVERAKDTVEWSEKLAKDGYITSNQLEQDRLDLQRKAVDLDKARTRISTIKLFENEKSVKELESNVEQTRLALDRVKRKASADVVQAEADLSAKQSESDRQKVKLEKIAQQITKTKMYAPQEGLVVYATTGQQGMRSGTEPLDEGQEVRERQDLIYLPTTASMMAQIKVHESALDKARVGLPVRLTIDALPGRSFTGTVAKIAPLPDAQSSFMNPDLKVYNTEIHMAGEAADLRTGMSCQAEIIVEEYASAMAVPVQSVVRLGRQPTVWVVSGDKVEARSVTIGKDNNRLVHILSGLKEGEKVLLSPPLDPTDAADTKRPGDSSAAPAAPGAAADGAAPAVEAPTKKKSGGSGGVDFKSLSPEERKKRFESMSPEDREKMKGRKKSGPAPDGAPGP